MLIALSGFSGKMGESIREVADNSYQIIGLTQDQLMAKQGQKPKMQLRNFKVKMVYLQTV